MLYKQWNVRQSRIPSKTHTRGSYDGNTIICALGAGRDEKTPVDIRIAGSDITTAAEVTQTRCQRYRSWRRKKVFGGSLLSPVKIANLDMQG